MRQVEAFSNFFLLSLFFTKSALRIFFAFLLQSFDYFIYKLLFLKFKLEINISYNLNGTILILFLLVGPTVAARDWQAHGYVREIPDLSYRIRASGSELQDLIYRIRASGSELQDLSYRIWTIVSDLPQNPSYGIWATGSELQDLSYRIWATGSEL